MRPVVFSFPTITANEICATQTTTVSASQNLLINGSLSNVAGGVTPFSAFLPGIQRSIQISSTGNISTSTFTISGFDTRATGILSTTIAGPTGLLIPTRTTTEFQTVTAISVNTLASSPFTVGVGATGSSNPIRNDIFVNPFNMSIAVITGTSQPVTIQDTPNDLNTAASPTWFNHATLVTVTANQEGNYVLPVNYVRAIFVATAVAAATSSATTVAQVTFIQSGSNV